MPTELRLTFSDSAHVAVALLGSAPDFSQPAAFASPITDKDMAELRWYVEDYGTTYAAEPDDARADAVKKLLPEWGAKLFAAVFKTNDKAAEIFRNFRDAAEAGRVLSIAADHPAVLSLPWELLATPGGSFLFNENPPVSIRRGLPSAGQGRAPQPRDPKPALHLLFIVSRPDGAGFINPRSDAEAVLDALKEQKPARVEVEFLRPATLEELRRRLKNERLPKVDIIHFDGHGVLASSGDADRKQGYLLFEGEWGSTDKVSGAAFGKLLNSSDAGLVVLSACQSAMMDSEDPMSGVAAQLVHADIPAVIAMSYSAFVITTKLLFAEFYRSLFEGSTVARSLDKARHFLCFNPKRGTRLRGAGGAEEFHLQLHDWFLPALYQSGTDQPLLSADGAVTLPPKPEPLHNLPDVQESGFFGRSRELWQIERFFAVNSCCRISITGFGGQGKTALALEAGRWLLRTGLFKQACFVSYAAYQGSDPVSLAISTMSAVLQESLLDAAAAKASLETTATLLILDNLESLADGRGLAELLDAAALWSEAGASRVLLTSRQPDFAHPSYPLAGSFDHRHLPLQGLREDDAVKWFDALRSLPPEPTSPRPQRDVLIRLFEQVGFHPLSISLLAQQLKERAASDVGERLEALLALQPLNREDRSLLASLELSIERLPKHCLPLLNRLGVFAGGCLEDMARMVTGLEKADWHELRSHLLRAGLMQAERLPVLDMTWLRFHPTLAPALWQKLGKEEQDKLLERYWQEYHQLSGALYELDFKNPHAARAIAKHELPNMFRAVHAALQTGRAEESVDFADNVNEFLSDFGMRRDYQALTEAAAKAGGTVGSQTWFLSRSDLGEQLFRNSQTAAAAQVFQGILAGLEETPSYNRYLTLHRLGRCCNEQGQPAEAERLYRQELAELARLEQSKLVLRQTSVTQTDLADVLRHQGRYTEAKAAYQAALKIDEELGDKRGMAVNNGQLGTLALEQDELAEAVKRWLEALALWQSLNEPASEAVAWHQLGLIYQKAKSWEEAEQAYRQAARLQEEQGLLGGNNGAGTSWQQLAIVCDYTGRHAEAEQWFRKALVVFQSAKDQLNAARALNNLAVLLADDLARLDEARRYAEESLIIKEILDPASAEIWKSYELLARIAAKQGESSQAAAYRAKGRQAYLAFPGWRQQLYQHEELITAVIEGGDVEAALSCYGESWANLIAAIQGILSGERDEAALCGPLDYENAATIRAILEGIAGKG
ncbi:MAG: Tetratricopeptide repeat-containing protein [Candidatus Electronema aureum]|uniref:Tetratricopeptide repeat-containing protein n=1 Tax=Candidatus Electronema aureum TaxID=2005002 RepID=A0A521G3D6_9BACT|nr:MAG: Tetratricopeptide repeat-containing protein [Candidatus Electronema aureum]